MTNLGDDEPDNLCSSMLDERMLYSNVCIPAYVYSKSTEKIRWQMISIQSEEVIFWCDLLFYTFFE